MTTSTSLRIIYLKQVGATVLWAGMYIASRIIAPQLPAFSASFLRFLMAGCLLLILWGFSRGTRLPAGQQWLTLAALGLTGAFLYNFFFFNGLSTVPAGRAAVIITTNPIFTALFARIVLKEKLPLYKIVGILCSACGAVLVITKGDLHTLFDSALSQGDLFLFGAAFSWAAYSVLNKLAKGIAPLTTITFTCVIGCALLLPFAGAEAVFSQLTSYPWQVWTALGYVALFGTVLPFIWFYQGVQALGAQRASLFINLIPAFTVLLAAAILKEPLEPSLLGGVLLVCCGIFLANRSA